MVISETILSCMECDLILFKLNVRIKLKFKK